MRQTGLGGRSVCAPATPGAAASCTTTAIASAAARCLRDIADLAKAPDGGRQPPERRVGGRSAMAPHGSDEPPVRVPRELDPARRPLGYRAVDPGAEQHEP